MYLNNLIVFVLMCLLCAPIEGFFLFKKKVLFCSKVCPLYCAKHPEFHHEKHYHHHYPYSWGHDYHGYHHIKKRYADSPPWDDDYEPHSWYVYPKTTTMKPTTPEWSPWDEPKWSSHPWGDHVEYEHEHSWYVPPKTTTKKPTTEKPAPPETTGICELCLKKCVHHPFFWV